MKGYLMLGSLVFGALLFTYEYFRNRGNDHHSHGRPPPPPPPDWSDFPPDNKRKPKRKMPGPEEVCSICLEALIKKDTARKYCIIALPQCGHWFHQKCAVRLLEYHPMCPVCRVDIDASMLRNTPVHVMDQSITIEEQEKDNEPRPSTSSASRSSTSFINQQGYVNHDSDLD